MNIEKEKQRLSQQKMLETLIREPKPTEMLTVYFSDDKNETHDHVIYSALVPIDQKEDVLSDHSWDLSFGSGIPTSAIYYENGEATPKYLRFGSNEGIEPLIIIRNFHGVKNDYIEISEEFRLFHNLYHDLGNNRYIKIDNDGNETTIIEMSKTSVKVRVKEIKQFLAIKKMFLSVQFDLREHSKLSKEELSLDERVIEGEEDLALWKIGYGDFEGINDQNAYSILLGKKLVAPFPKSKSGLYGFRKEEAKKFVDFIIDIDDIGDEIKYTSNPDLLANYFGANPDAPNYLTPVHFKKEVLDKYYNRPSKFSVEDSYLRCAGLWGLQIDNHHDDKVCVWLGDLGNSLPYEEQLHWRSCNIAPAGGVSKTYFNRQIMANATNSERPEHIFKSRYSDLNKICKKNLGWSLLLPLNGEDSHHFDALRIPSTNEQNDFDNLVLGLTKILIDSLNEKNLNNYIDKTMRGNIKGGISRFEKVLQNELAENYETHIKFLRKLQNLRSSSSAHRKGSNYKKIATEFEIGNKDLIAVFEGIMNKSIDLLEYLIKLINSGKLFKYQK